MMAPLGANHRDARRRDLTLRRQCRALLSGLDVRPPLDVAALCARIGQLRGRPIELVERPIPVPGPFGAWLAGAQADYILYQRETSRAHQDHIILHELGHILARHHSDQPDDEALRGLHPDSDPDAVRKALRRTEYSTAAELEAELIATIILEWSAVLAATAWPLPTTEPASQRRLAEALADSRGWL
jgi:hypothetical protein